MRTTKQFMVAVFLTLHIGCGVRDDFPESGLSTRRLDRALSFAGANWEINSDQFYLSKLRKFRAGDNDPRLAFADTEQDSTLMEITSDLPSHFDWRSMAGQDFVSPVGQQGDCGACVAFAMLGTMESQLNIHRRTPYSPWEFSRQELFSCGGGKCKGGWKLSEAVAFVTNRGATDAACMSYQSGQSGTDTPCTSACNPDSQRLQRVASVERPTTGFVDVEKIKRALLRGPLLSSMILYEDFMFYGHGVYRHTEGRGIGSHAVMIIGWDDAQNAWIGRNSMGTRWGMNGDFLIARDDVSLIGRYTYLFSFEEAPNFAAFQDLRNDHQLKGIVDVNVHSSSDRAEQVDLFLTADQGKIYAFDPESKVASAQAINEESPTQGQVFKPQVDTRQLQDGEYYLYCAANSGQSRALTQPVKIKIVNGEAKTGL
jgi:C1A family cysteine protease